MIKALTAKIFGHEVVFSSERFMEVKNEKNPYLIGRWLDHPQRFDVYAGRNGIKIVPYRLEVFVRLIFVMRTSDANEGVYVDGNRKGFCAIYVKGGRVREIFVFRRDATSNSNELEGLRFALRAYPGKKIFSDSSYSIKKVMSKRVEKVKSHSGVLWNCIPDYILKNL